MPSKLARSDDPFLKMAALEKDMHSRLRRRAKPLRKQYTTILSNVVSPIKLATMDFAVGVGVGVGVEVSVGVGCGSTEARGPAIKIVGAVIRVLDLPTDVCKQRKTPVKQEQQRSLATIKNTGYIA